MQAQVIQDTSAKAVPAHRQQAPAQSAPQQSAAPKAKSNEPSPARILTEAFEDLRRRLATLEGRIIEGSNTGEVARIAQMLERVEGRLDEGGNGFTMQSKRTPGILSVALLTLIAFGTGIIAAEHSPELRVGIEQITLSATTFWHAALDRIGDLLA